MTDGDSIAHVAVVILLLILAVPTLSTAHTYAGTPFSYEEQVTVDYNNTTAVSQTATVEGYGENVTIVDSDQDKTLVEGEDYDWNESSGEITWYNNANTADGDNATIWYDAYQRTDETAMAWDIISPFMALFGLFGFVASVRALWSFTAEVWDL